jgi:hypothetical protein
MKTQPAYVHIFVPWQWFPEGALAWYQQGGRKEKRRYRQNVDTAVRRGP